MHPGLLVGAGFLLGTVGVKALKSEPAKKLMVQAAVQGMRVKDEAETLIDEAKAEFDDVIAQASYEKQLAEGTVEVEAEVADAPAADAPAGAAAVKPAVETASKAVADAAKTVKKVAASAAKTSGSGRGAGAGHGMGHGRGGK